MPDTARYRKIDLHSHSTRSDGKLSPTALVDLAVEQNVSLFALTDHDTIDGVAEASLRSAEHGLSFIHGVELSTQWNGIPLHMVALNFSLDNSALLSIVKGNQAIRLDRARRIADLLIKQGLPDLFDEAIALAGESQLGRPHFAQLLIEKGVVKDANKAFDRYLGNKKLGQIRDVWPDLEAVLGALSGHNMELVLAHPKRYPLTVSKLKRLLGDFKRWGGTGMEVASGNERPDSVRLLERLSREFGLKASAGSDYHGPFGPWMQVGKFTQIHESEVDLVWQTWP
ncbi:PHP domain-containing protein [Marinomonas sp. M1K-6]|uniref:PHP domain-containing protein n=1 Tax=Marinomonas profundi TaxID=2726122 RepID=A0A847R2N5_9GAMM|nr:PHP domain-containing protein [Marinomonas profundi]NLQ16583.1 PHP domain-containing protein [Marinomonas profundi]UDV03832.1 PHP domain-containing protein [Marinomonas profundi]